ncbi:hypothetical protein L2X99_08935 [Microbacterium sp. KUDC0406]|uniref:hypothetical protein n=1 Tax=Microbacterium sp. KUDC0406 TaxID=2909588 RepID=UPI001F1C3EDF|nr:hypothetical protein [Microbacterium sp. KUDC0406]UJP11582.1 hypothetical protein L2X99_08935 [Microbacterium sp. KUDC0406]
MPTSEDIGGSSPSAAAEALQVADAVARRIRSRRRWYIAGALVMALALAGFTIALAVWPDRLADVIIPGLLVVLALLAVLAWSGRTIPTGAVAVTNRVVLVSAVLMVVALLLNRMILPEGFSVWAVLTALLPALPFLYLAWRTARA